jgi:hypothetical protein
MVKTPAKIRSWLAGEDRWDKLPGEAKWLRDQIGVNTDEKKKKTGFWFSLSPTAIS